jgi:hypothetical protein
MEDKEIFIGEIGLLEVDLISLRNRVSKEASKIV